jgi:hypothetical protein
MPLSTSSGWGRNRKLETECYKKQQRHKEEVTKDAVTMHKLITQSSSLLPIASIICKALQNLLTLTYTLTRFSYRFNILALLLLRHRSLFNRCLCRLCLIFCYRLDRRSASPCCSFWCCKKIRVTSEIWIRKYEYLKLRYVVPSLWALPTPHIFLFWLVSNCISQKLSCQVSS